VQNKEAVKEKPVMGKKVFWDKGDTLMGKAADVIIPPNALYENAWVDWKEGWAVWNGDSAYYVGWTTEDVIWAEKPTWHLKDHHQWTQKLGWYNELSGDWKKIDSLGNARMKLPGRNFLLEDSIPPVMLKGERRMLPKEMVNSQFAFYAQVSDALSGLKSVEGWVDGQWVLLCCDAKNKLVYLDPKYEFSKSTIELKVICEDQMGNVMSSLFTVNRPVSSDTKK
jgi:hypothetical protein